LDWASVTPRLDNEQPPEFGRSSFFAVAYGSSGFIAIDGDTDPRVLRLVP
jgi:hypothetical protein